MTATSLFLLVFKIKFPFMFTMVLLVFKFKFTMVLLVFKIKFTMVLLVFTIKVTIDGDYGSTGVRNQIHY